MTSGIYALEFTDGSTYIGKAVDIEARWAQHRDKLISGKAAYKLQQAYNVGGMPQFKIVYKVHLDHIDILESILIEQNRDNPLLLNTAKGHRVSERDEATIREHVDLLEHSTAEHLRALKITAAENEDRRLKLDGCYHQIGKLERDIAALEAKGIKMPNSWKDWWHETNQELERLKGLEKYAITYSKMNWFDRLFNPFKL